MFEIRRSLPMNVLFLCDICYRNGDWTTTEWYCFGANMCESRRPSWMVVDRKFTFSSKKCMLVSDESDPIVSATMGRVHMVRTRCRYCYLYS